MVFGQVIEGYEVVKKIERYGSQSGKPSKTVTIVDCGQLYYYGDLTVHS